MLDTYCWVEGTWTKNVSDDTLAAARRGDHHQNMACIDEEGDLKTNDNGDPLCNKHVYYQWVALVLVFQAGAFYFPK